MLPYVQVKIAKQHTNLGLRTQLEPLRDGVKVADLGQGQRLAVAVRVGERVDAGQSGRQREQLVGALGDVLLRHDEVADGQEVFGAGSTK